MTIIMDLTREKIKAYLEVFIENLIAKYKDRKTEGFQTSQDYLLLKSKKGSLKPFHAAIIPSELIRISAFERGFSTSLGTTFEECAKLIGKDYFEKAERGHSFEKEVSISAINEIDKQIRLFEHAAKSKENRPSLKEMLDSIYSRLDGRKTNLKIQADVYLKSVDGKEYFFEIKSPQPNKGQCLEILQRLLRFYLIKEENRNNCFAYFAMGYNPYGKNRIEYNWNFSRNYFPLDEAALIGHEFWDLIGGKDTQQELLDIYREVGKEKAKYMLDSLAFGF